VTAADAQRRAAGEHAVAAYVRDGMRLGLGTGATAGMMLAALAARLADGRLRDITGVATSETTAERCRELGIPLTTLKDDPTLDVVIDGADEIDPGLNLIKGLGGAHLREKVVACAAELMVVVADEAKLVARLGERAPLPVEVVEFARPVCDLKLRELGWQPLLRLDAGGRPFVTDEGNAILDCRRDDDWPDPPALAAGVRTVPGVVEHGFFLGMASVVVIGTGAGVRVLEPGSHPAAAP
jgi:ribose 5-phosphate isomerase A